MGLQLVELWGIHLTDYNFVELNRKIKLENKCITQLNKKV